MDDDPRLAVKATGWIALAAAAMMLHGCFFAPLTSVTAQLATGAASLYTTNLTGKTPFDHAVSMHTGQDCAMVHFENNQPYCMDKDGRSLGLAVEKVCYATLGNVECTYGPDPYGTRPNPVH